nr:hypothetical protein [Tanacetum cinerariifolium]
MRGARGRAYAIDGRTWYSVVSSTMNQLHSFKCAQVGGARDEDNDCAYVEVRVVVFVVWMWWCLVGDGGGRGGCDVVRVTGVMWCMAWWCNEDVDGVVGVVLLSAADGDEWESGGAWWRVGWSIRHEMPRYIRGHSLKRVNTKDLGPVMSSSDSTVTYTSVSSEDVPLWGIRFFGMKRPDSPETAPQSPIQTPPVPQDEDDREPMFIQPHDLNYVPGPMYPEYIPLEEEHILSAEEQPLPPVVSPTAESPEDDDDGDSSGNDADDEDEDKEDEEEEEEHLAPADFAIVIPIDELVSPPERTEHVMPPPSTDTTTTRVRITVRLQAVISFPPEAEVERLLTMPTPSPSPLTLLSPPSVGELPTRCTAPAACLSPPPVPSPLLPSSGCPTQIQTLRLASTQALIDAVTAAIPSPPHLYIPPPVDRRDDIPKSRCHLARGGCGDDAIDGGCHGRVIVYEGDDEGDGGGCREDGGT